VDRTNAAAKELRRRIFRQLASQQINANARHFYLETALEDDDRLNFSILDVTPAITQSSVKKLLSMLSTTVKADEVDGVRMAAVFNFTDIQEAYLLKLEDSVLRVSTIESPPPNPDLVLTTTAQIFKEVAAGLRNPLFAYIKGDLQIVGGLFKFKTFMSYFETAEGS
jgi:alkyl sulfatase BDS1-like metallo-beta-lactamase superfamily hydrolase